MQRIYRFPLINLLFILAVTLFLSFQLPNTKIDNDVLTFLPKDHPTRLAIDKQEELFGGVMLIDVVMESDQGSVITPEGLKLLQQITSRFENIKGVDEVESLFSTDYLAGTPEGMEVSPIADPDRGFGPAEIAAIRERLISWDAYRKMLISDDFSATQIGVRYGKSLDSAEREEIYRQLEEITADYSGGDFRFYIAGTPAITVLVSKNMESDLATLIPFVLIVLILMLSLSFRRLGGVLLPLLTVTISTIWIIGFMAFLHVALSILGIIIPVLMLAVGSAYGIHLVSHYYDELASLDGPLSEEQHREIVLTTVKRVGVPIVLAGLTTLAGFGSLAVSQVIPMRVFGIFTALGVLIALLVSLIFIPSVLLLRHSAMKRTGGTEDSGPGLLIGRLIKRLNSLATRHKSVVLVIFLLIGAGAVWGTSHLIVDNALIEYFKKSTDIRTSDRVIREKFAGTKSFDLIISGKKPGDMADPAILDAMDKLAAYLEKTYPQVSKVLSYSDFIRRMNQVMHVGDPGSFQASATPVQTAAPQQAVSPQGTPDAAWDDGSFFSGDSGSDTAAASSAPAPDDGSFFSDSSSDTSGTSGTGESSGWADARAWSQAPEPALTTADGAGMDLKSAAKLLKAAYASGGNMNMNAGELVRQAGILVNLDGLAYDEIPVDPAKYGLKNRDELKNLVSQYLLLYSGSLDSWADDALEPQIARMTITMNTTGNIFTNHLVPDLKAYTAANFPSGYTVKTAGVALAESAVTELVTSAAINSILLSLVLVFLIVAVTYRSMIAGFYGAVPLGITVLINFGVMGLAGIKLDIATAMVGSIAIGIGIDYTIHFLASYRYARLETADLVQVTERALNTSGKAIIYNAVSVAAGFLVLGFSRFNPILYLGVLIALTMVTSSLASMTIIPVLLNIFKPKFIAGQRPARGNNNKS